jgi:hypothetical protein
MGIWTIQKRTAWEYLEEHGVLHARREHQDDSWLEAYAWIEQQFIKRVGPPPEEDVALLWGWYQCHDAKKQRPDLRVFRYAYQYSHLPAVCGTAYGADRGSNRIMLLLGCTFRKDVVMRMGKWKFWVLYPVFVAGLTTALVLLSDQAEARRERAITRSNIISTGLCAVMRGGCFRATNTPTRGIPGGSAATTRGAGRGAGSRGGRLNRSATADRHFHLASEGGLVRQHDEVRR